MQLDRPTYATASRTMAFTSQCSPATTLFLVAGITYLGGMEG